MKFLKALAAGAALTATTASAQVIVTIDYRPPETVQRVAIPVNPAEKRLQVLIISGRNSYEHDWTGVNNMLRTLMQDTKRFDVRVTEGRCWIRVADSGAGLQTSDRGLGTGLTALRERLALVFGDAAALRIRAREPRGVVSELEFPAREAAP